MINLGGAFLQITGNINPLQRALAQAKGHVNGFAKDTTGKFNVIKGAITAVSSTLAAMAVGAAIRKSVSEFTAFEKASSRIGNVTKENIGAIKDRIKALPSELGDFTSLMEGYYQVVSAGVQGTSKQMETLATSSKVAKEAGLQQGEVVRGLASLMGAYGKELGSASKAADLLYTIEKNGITTVGELIPYIGSLGNQAASLGLSATEMAASLSQVSTAGAGTAESATQLSAVMTALMKPTKEMEAALNKYGGAQKAIKDLGFAGVLRELVGSTKGNTSALTDLFGRVEAVRGVLQLSRNSFAELDQKLKDTKESAGASADAWNRYKETLSASFETLTASTKNLFIAIGEKLAPTVNVLVTSLTSWIDKNRDLIASGMEKFLVVIGQGLLTVIGNIGSAVRAIGLFHNAWLQVKYGIQAVIAKVAEITNWLYKHLVRTLLSPFDDMFKALVKLGAVESNPFDSLGRALDDFAFSSKQVKEEMAKDVDTAKAKYDELAAKIDQVTAGTKDAGAVLAGMASGNAWEQAFTGAKTASKNVEELKTKTKELTTSNGVLIEGLYGLSEGAGQAADAVDGAGDAADKAKNKIVQMGNAAGPVGQQITEMAASAQVTLQNFANSIRNLTGSTLVGATGSYTYNPLKAAGYTDAQISAMTESERSRLAKQLDNKLYAAQLQAAIGTPDQYRQISTMFASQSSRMAGEEIWKKAGLDYNYTGSYASGTGPQGLPETGFFLGHKGEIVKSKKESDAERGSFAKTEIHIHAGAFVGNQSDARTFADLLLKEINFKTKRLGM